MYLGVVEGQQQGSPIGEEDLGGVVPQLPPALVDLLHLLVRPGEGRRLRLAMQRLTHSAVQCSMGKRAHTNVYKDRETEQTQTHEF